MTVLPRVLLVDDDPGVQRGVEFCLRGKADLTACRSAKEALDKVRGVRFDAALVDVHLGEGPTGTQLLSRLRDADPDLTAVIFTAHADYDTAVESLRAHSFDFIPKNLRDDGLFRSKIDQAVTRTREQRERSREAAEATRLRGALADALVAGELEISNNDIQRGLLGESLQSFSSLLGRVELTNVLLKRQRVNSEELVKLSDETMKELQDYVGKLRDYFAEPERATNSMNEILARAVNVVREDGTAGDLDFHVELAELRPDQTFAGDGRALLRAVVILLRMIARTSKGPSAICVKPSVLFNPAIELNILKSRSAVCILNTPNFRKDERIALCIEIEGGRGEANEGRLPPLFSPAASAQPGSLQWSALAMIARLNGALVVEPKIGAGIRYRIILKS